MTNLSSQQQLCKVGKQVLLSRFYRGGNWGCIHVKITQLVVRTTKTEEIQVFRLHSLLFYFIFILSFLRTNIERSQKRPSVLLGIRRCPSTAFPFLSPPKKQTLWDEAMQWDNIGSTLLLKHTYSAPEMNKASAASSGFLLESWVTDPEDASAILTTGRAGPTHTPSRGTMSHCELSEHECQLSQPCFLQSM